ncbi:monovalent cation/H+ antiporter subunit A [Roseicyclus sp. F158]|uniref:Monovalent cation/H+ antiporter subunit A n=1 Tax=Tropicimonas omnivorans TaxID=3075590 RepID=A0ABU3DIK3_9RHOB|nr:monovalent cation/H+ antiporter subunit A [Roseicyclus sp. F158]MDT0683369.1 monovalent cation/H+ antiporter subunit A [Roseicyclus sp. F158]
MEPDTDSTLILIAALPFIGALFPGLMIRAGRTACAVSAGAATLAALVLLVALMPSVLQGDGVAAGLDWMPQLGLQLSFRLDGLGLLFAFMILGIGLLIIIYARGYLSREDPMGQFYTYLMLFQGAMLGIVLSDNILLLTVFWELTSLSSFLLIGYWKHLPEGRQGARMALTVTGLGGLALIGGALLLGRIAGTYEISEMLAMRDQIQASPLYLPALILILLGAFTKSAQFPFHFWLPHAMAAPTPVSAYLHSATMVKAGLFLMARLWPVLSGTPEWFYIVASAGLITMVLGALIAIFKHDLKALLAFSTVSHLGLITMLLGFGTEAAAIAAVFHILNHSAFKAALFMTAGIVDHEAHTRDIRRLGGLMRLMPITALIGTLAALSMAGIPLLNGFISKEMMLEEASHTYWLGNEWLIPVLATLGALLSAAYCFRFIAHTFGGKVRSDYPHVPHDPPGVLWLPPALLVVLVVAIGVAPALFAGWLVDASASAVTGSDVHTHLALWHGVTPALFMSGIAVAGGLLLLALFGPLGRTWDRTPRPEAKRMFDGVVAGAVRAANGVADGLHDGRISRPFVVLTLAVLAAATGAFFRGGHEGPQTEMLPVGGLDVTVWALLVTASAAAVSFHRNRIIVLISMGIIGLVVSLAFVRLSAPDLALTQVSVEVVTIMLMLIALHFLPKRTPLESPVLRRWWHGMIAAAGGLGVGALSYLLMLGDTAKISPYFLENAKSGGGGTNVVNVILVDFRGFDTFGEIIVLGIAALTIFAIGEALLDGRASRRLANWRDDVPRSKDRHPLMMVVATRVMMPIAIMVGVFIFLRGHNQPGGGFIAGLVIAIALLMQYMASGFAWSQERQKYPYHSMIGMGVLIAALTGIASWFAGYPFLTSAYTYVHFRPIEEFELASAIAFDIGVLMTVVGAVMLALYSLSRLARRTGETVNEEAMDYDPAGPSGAGEKGAR